MSATALTLPALLARTLTSLLPVFNDELSTSRPDVQQRLHDALADLALARRMIDTLGLFSGNESIEDVADGEMVYMAVDWVVAEAQGRVNGDGLKGRIAVLERSKEAYEAFLWLLETYEFPLQDGQTYGPATSALPQDPAGRRDAKIKQFKMEKALKEKVSAATGIPVSSSAMPAILALINHGIPNHPDPSPASRINVSNPTTSVNSEPTAQLRTATIALLSLLLTQTHTALATIDQELSLLRSASMSAHIEAEERVILERDRNARQRAQEGDRKGLKEDEMWRLDAPLRFGTRARGKVAELIDERGKPMQPFTILPSTGLQDISSRARLQAEVFRSSHRLPTMTIDEYLDEERRRGNIITGGGPESENQLTESEQLAIDAEADGTVAGELKAEQKRQKDEKWARYTDTHRKGEGNTVNRG